MSARRGLSALVWSGGAVMALGLSGTVVFGLTEDYIWQGEQSEWVERFVEAPAVTAQAAKGPVASPLPNRFGPADGASTLVLYDRTGEPGRGALYGLAAAHLATHFGQVEIIQVSSYDSGDLDDYDAAVYVGSSHLEVLPEEFVADVRAGTTPVIWAGGNIHQLAGEEGSVEAGQFLSTYGWDPAASEVDTTDELAAVRYKDQLLERETVGGAGLLVPRIGGGSPVEVLATAVCGEDPAQPVECAGSPDGASEVPWAIRSANLTYVGEIPFDYMTEQSRYLAFADLYYDVLAPDTEPVRYAAVRLEDVGAEANPEHLRRVADYLYAEGVPFQVAVVPIHIAKAPQSDPVRWYGLSLSDRPEVVEALKYMQARGGTLIQHGTTHQYGALDNPYSGSSGADYEFYQARCSDTADFPYELEPCEQDSWVQLTEPVGDDTVQQHIDRIAAGRQVMAEAGLGEPEIFETPHYAASANAYQAMAEVYDTRYERTEYFAEVMLGEQIPGAPSFTQLFPYRVQDIYGSTVLPENIGNISIVEQNNHPPRPPEFLIDGARANLVVRESVASFFFHPFLDLDLLEEAVQGIKGLGYTFVPAAELP